MSTEARSSNPVFQASLMEKHGFYSLIQYIPDKTREEGVNCGILLVVPSEKYLDIKTIDTSVRILSIFNEPDGANRLRASMRSIKKSVLEHKDQLLEEGSYHLLPIRDYGPYKFGPLRNHKIHPNSRLEDAHGFLFSELVEVDEDSLLVNAIKELLNCVKEDLFLADNLNSAAPGNLVSFRRATEILEAADAIREIIED